MNIPNKIKRGRGRPRKSDVIKPQEASIVEVPIPIVEVPIPIVEAPIIVETPPEPITVKKVRKANRWVEHCTEVKNRPENIGMSYREILKIAKLDYQK